MNELIYPHDRRLTAVSLAVGIVVWVTAAYFLVRLGGSHAVLGSLITVLWVALVAFLTYLFSRSAAVAHITGHGIEVSDEQFPELHRQHLEYCAKLSLATPPRFFILNGNGVLNAFATWFLGRRYVVLLSNVVDSMEQNPSGIRFYLGHELGHVIRHDGPLVGALRWPALRLPLLGAAFSRARESTCDRHGLACCASGDDAARALAALQAGARRWRTASLDGLTKQLATSGGFWASFHELTASYPWTSKRVLRVQNGGADIPARNPFAYLLAAFVPYAGRLGAGLGVLLYVYVIGILAAVAIPAYQDYTARAVLSQAITVSQPARDALAAAYLQSRQIPSSLAAAGISQQAPGGVALSLDSDHMVLTVTTPRGALRFIPRRDDSGNIVWKCAATPTMRPGQVPPMCR